VEDHNERRRKQIHITSPGSHLTCLVSYTSVFKSDYEVAVRGKDRLLFGISGWRPGREPLPIRRQTHRGSAREDVSRVVCTGRAEAGLKRATYINQTRVGRSKACAGKPLSIGRWRESTWGRWHWIEMAEAPVQMPTRPERTPGGGGGIVLDILDPMASFLQARRVLLAIRSHGVARTPNPVRA